MYLSEVPLYRDTITQQICSNDKIIDLIRPDDMLGMKSENLIYKYIFPYDHIIDKATAAGTYLCFDIEAPRIVNRTFVDLRIYFWIITHDRKIATPKGLRGDLLSIAIEKMMNGSRNFGLGAVELQAWGRFSPAEKFHGRLLMYQTVDFNRE